MGYMCPHSSSVLVLSFPLSLRLRNFAFAYTQFNPRLQIGILVYRQWAHKRLCVANPPRSTSISCRGWNLFINRNKSRTGGGERAVKGFPCRRNSRRNKFVVCRSMWMGGVGGDGWWHRLWLTINHLDYRTCTQNWYVSKCNVGFYRSMGPGDTKKGYTIYCHVFLCRWLYVLCVFLDAVSVELWQFSKKNSGILCFCTISRRKRNCEQWF